MNATRDHALVIGASMAGLLAARALAETYERITIVERDELPAGAEQRRAVPQGRHVHALLPRGQEELEQLLPGITAELVDAGAVTYEALSEMYFSVHGHPMARVAMNRDTLLASRPLIEAHVRRRVRALPGVEIRDRCDVAGLVASAGRERITGVRILPRADGSAEEVLTADVVVAAGGRSGRLPAWLEGLGYPRPHEDRVAIDIMYASRPLRVAPGALGRDKLVLIGARPGCPRTLALAAQEHGRWLLTVAGYRGHHPPTDPDGFLAFATGVAPPAVAAAIRDAEPLGDIVTHGFPANVRRRYERLRRFPAGLVPIGDAVCSFNPLYGQGMAVSVVEAAALRRCLADGTGDLARRFFAAAGPSIDHAWEMAIGGDLALPEVDGPRPARLRAINAYLGRLQAAAEHDPVVAMAFVNVVSMLEKPQRLLRPRIVRRVVMVR
jgi:2-polyprenyl-6-methoxyphenol hydroxylase-like FAD-dependent oxidoreductase